MGLDVGVSGKAILLVLVLLVGGFLALFAPSLITVLALFAILGLIAYGIWLVGVRVNRRLTGRKGGL